MEVVLRTPNGEAEVALAPGQEESTLGDLVETVTGRPASQIVFVDGRAVPSETTIGACGLLTGSTIATIDDAEPPPVDGRVEIVQIAGRGAGTRRWLSPGRYRIGVGRRVSAQDLEAAPVDTPMLELSVDAGGTVSVRAAETRARLDGTTLSSDEPTIWTGGYVDVAGRVFALGGRDPGAVSTTGHRFAGTGVDGAVAFNRPPRIAAAPEFPPLVVPDAAAETRPSGRFSSRADRAAVQSFTSAARDRHDQVTARRRAAHPDLADAAQLAESSAPELWQRRPGHPDAFHVAVGLADLEWSPVLSPVLSPTGPAHAGAEAIVRDLGPTPMVPVVIDLVTERGVGVVGDSEFATSIARGLVVEAAVTHGPADLDVVILSSADRAHVWEWVKWLPHARSGSSVRIYSTEEQVAGWSAAVRRAWEAPAGPAAPSHLTVVVVDEPTWWSDRAAPLRPLFADPSMPLRFVALTDSVAGLPSVCTTVVKAQSDHRAAVDFLAERRHLPDVHPFMASEHLALRIARRLAPLDDPDVAMVSESTLPSVVPLSALLELGEPTAGDVVTRWSQRDGEALPVIIGVCDRGPLELDLVADGPHALIAGATGSGKSELLRALVVGIAAECSPDDVNVLLVEATDGSAFGACRALPHTVGLVTGLDGRTAGRLVRCLRAEVRYRESVLRASGVTTLVEQRGRDDVERLPRLLVVVDEFAPAAVELADFLPSLADIAERGRGLGLHLILATRRPAGVVNDRIRANTNLRIAMRVHDDGDSLDTIGSAAAAQLPQRRPGRAYARIGSGDLTMFQASHPSGVSLVRTPAAAAAERAHRRIDVTPYVVARERSPLENRLTRRTAQHTAEAARSSSDLVRLVDVINGAAAELGQIEHRRPCPDPLPEHLAFESFLAEHPGDGIPYALVDRPDEQRQVPAWWSPGREGSLLVHGSSGAGTSSLLVSLTLGIAERFAADDVHVYCIDADSGHLAPLEALPHVGAVARLDEPDRIARVATHLNEILAHRERLALELDGAAAVAATEPAIVLMIDDIAGVRRQLEDRRDLDGTWERLERIIADGQPLGLCAVVTAKQESDVPPSLAAAFHASLVMRMADPLAYSSLGVETSGRPVFAPGRAVRPDDMSELQLVEPPPAVAEAIRASAFEEPAERAVRRIEPLPAVISVDELVGGASRTDGTIVVPVGLDTRTARPASCIVSFGENVIVSGAPGTGRSSILVAFAEAARRFEPSLPVFVAAPRRGPLADLTGVDRPSSPNDVAAWVERVAWSREQRLVLVDDADRLDDPSFDRLAGLRDDRLIVVVAGRNDDLRAPGHWSRPLQRFRHGVLLRPEPGDGDLLRVSLGARLPAFGPHRGILVVDGEQIPLLAAVVDVHSSSGGGR